MHEFTILRNIFIKLEELVKDNDLKLISKVVLQVGKLRQIAPDFLQFAFAVTAEKTVAKDAKLIVEFTPGKEVILKSIEGDR